MTDARLKEHREYLKAWEKAQACTYPNCRCIFAHALVAEVCELARCVGHEFVPDREKIASTSLCKATP